MKEFVIAKPHHSENVISTDHNNADQPTILILACDGLWDVFEDEEALSFCKGYVEQRTNVAEALCEEAIRRGSTDNVSVVVVWLS